VTTAMLTSPPPPPDCVLGAAFEYVESWTTGFEAEVRVRSWRGGARFELDFGAVGLPVIEVIHTWRAVLEEGGLTSHDHARQRGSQHNGGGDGAGSGGSAALVLVPEPRGKDAASYTAFRLTARSTSPMPAADVASDGNDKLPRPMLSCTVAQHPPPPPRTAQHASPGWSGSWSPPEQPAPPRVARASCASLELEWDEPETFGWSLEEYRVLLRRPGLPMKNAAEGLKATHTELTGLLASTTYTLFVQAKGPAGWSKPSEPTYGATEPALRLPARPWGAPKAAPAATATAQLRAKAAPSPQPYHELLHSASELAMCESGTMLSLPELRGGCSGDEWLTVEVQRADEPGVWLTAVKHALASDVWVAHAENERAKAGESPLDALTAVYARVVAHNSIGASAAGARSEAFVPHHSLSAAVHPPLAEATSSSSIIVHGSNHSTSSGRVLTCRVDDGVRFEVLLRHEGSTEWTTLLQIGEAGAPLPIQIGSVPCHGGCYVKLRALNIAGWRGFGHPSSKVLTPPPPAATPPDGARIELKMSAPLASPRAATASKLLLALASATSLDPAQLSVVEVCRSGVFVTMDVEAGRTAGRPRDGATVSDTLRKLVSSREALEHLPAGLKLDLRFGVRRQVLAEGVSLDAPDAIFSEQLLEGALGGGRLHPESKVRGLTLGLIGIILFCACCWPLLNIAVAQLQQWHANRAERQAALSQPTLLAASPQDDSDHGEGFDDIEHEDNGREAEDNRSCQCVKLNATTPARLLSMDF